MNTVCPNCLKKTSWGGQLYQCPSCGKIACHRCTDALFGKKCPRCGKALNKKADQVHLCSR